MSGQYREVNNDWSMLICYRKHKDEETSQITHLGVLIMFVTLDTVKLET